MVAVVRPDLLQAEVLVDLNDVAHHRTKFACLDLFQKVVDVNRNIAKSRIVHHDAFEVRDRD